MAVNKLKWCRVLSTWPNLSDGAFRFGFVLVEHFDFGEEQLWAAQSTLAKMVGRSERMANQFIGELVEAGFLTSKRGGPGRPSRYCLRLPDTQDAAGLDTQDPAGQENADTQDPAVKTGRMLRDKTRRILRTTSLNELLDSTPEQETGSAPSPESGSDYAVPSDIGHRISSVPRAASPAPDGRKPSGPKLDEAAYRQIVEAWGMHVEEADARIAIAAALRTHTLDQVCEHIRSDVSSVDLGEALAPLRRRRAA